MTFLAPIVGKLTRGYVVDVLKELFGIDIHDSINEFYRDIGDWIGDNLISPLLNIIYDPLILDLDGDGVELSPLDGSTVHFDYDQDGFAERTGWVSPDDGILVLDGNGNGTVDGASELFGSPTQDGFAVLETFDSNGDGVIDASDEAFGKLRVWRDLDQDGVSDAGEMMTLAEAGIVSISLTRTDVEGTDAGHGIGYEALFTRADGTTGIARTIYFQTDRQDTRADNTPEFTPGEGVLQLPQLPGSGQINSIAWKATQDAAFKADWAELTDNAATLSRDELRARFEDLMLRWASVDAVVEGSRGDYVDARHLAFVEKFFGTTYREVYAGQSLTTSPRSEAFGNGIEASFDQIIDVMLTAYLSQTVGSVIARGGDLGTALESPYFVFALLDFREEWPEGVEPPATPGNVGMVLDLVKGLMPTEVGAAARYLETVLSGMDGMATVGFGGNRAAYLAAASSMLAGIADGDLRKIAMEIVKGTAALGSKDVDGLMRIDGDNVFIGGKGDDMLLSGAGSDLFVYSRGDGIDYIRDSSSSLSETDTLLLTDLSASDLTFERIGDTLIIKIAGSTGQITAEDFFADWGTKNRSIDQIRLADGSIMDRETIRSLTTTVGDGRNNLIQDTAGNDVLRGGKGHDTITISGGNDTILYAAGDGFDTIDDDSGLKTEKDILVLAGLNPSDVELSRSGDALRIKIVSTGEVITDLWFFANSADPDAANGWNNHGWGISGIKFANGVLWDRYAIVKHAWIRGNDAANSLVGSGLDDTFIGGGGNDTLSGGAGSDNYAWTMGDGHDVISDYGSGDSSVDRLVLENVRSSINLSRSGEDLRLTVEATGEVILIKGQFAGSNDLSTEWNSTEYGVEEIAFSNGFKWNRQAIAEMVGDHDLGFKADVTLVYHVVGGSVYIDAWNFTDEFGNTGDIFDYSKAYIYYNFGGGDNDIVYGSEDGDIVGIPSVMLQTDGNNYFDGKGGNDLLIGGGKHDTLLGGEGNDTLYGDENSTDSDELGHDALKGEEGDDILYGGAGNDYLDGGAGADELYGGAGADYLQDASADDEVFDGGKGDDILVSAQVRGTANSGANTGNDTFVYRLGDGNDVIFDGSYSLTEIDRLVLVNMNPDDVELSKNDNSINLVIKILSTNETIVDEGFFWRWGEVGHGLDRIEFADGTVWTRTDMRDHALATPLRGTSSYDYIQSNGAWAQTFDGGLGDDIIISASARGSANNGALNGNDTFIYRRGDGNDIIFDGSHSTTETDRLVLIGIDSDEVQLSRVDDHLLIKDLVTGQTITDEYLFWSFGSVGHGVERIEFADGVVWNKLDMRDRAWLRGTETRDQLQSNSVWGETFDGGLGDDIIISASARGSANNGISNGNDTFIYRRGDGNDIIFDGSRSTTETDRLVLIGINSDEVEVSRVGDHFLIKDLVTGQTITDEYLFWSFGTVSHGVERIEFADGVVWNREDIRYWTQEGSVFYAGTSAAETLIGSHYDQRLSGGGGNDFIDGKGGTDLLFGDLGDDTLALTVADIGEVDALDGGAGIDTATFAGFGAAVRVDLVESEGLAQTSDGPALLAGSLRTIATLRGLENVVGTAFHDEIFGDAGNNGLSGGLGNDLLDGRSGNDTLNGGKGNDILDGYLGNDTFIYGRGDGNDTIYETPVVTGSSDRIRLTGIAPSQIAFERVNGNLVIVIEESGPGAGDGGRIAVVGPQNGQFHYDEYGIESIELDGGIVWDQSTLRQMSIADSATNGDDVLVGTGASGTFAGLRGNDTITGAGGNDVYIYTRGDGNDTYNEATGSTSYSGSADRVVLQNILPSAVRVERSGDNLVLVIAESSPGSGDGGRITLIGTGNESGQYGIESVAFDDGTVWSVAQLRALFYAGLSTAGDDTITGFYSEDTFEAGAGDDTVIGAGRNDTYIYNRGDGNDTYNEATGSTYYSGVADRVLLKNIATSSMHVERLGNDLVLVIAETSVGAGDGGRITLVGTGYNNGQYGIESVVFDDGTTKSKAQLWDNAWLVGTSGNDTLAGYSTADCMIGEGGNDTMTGAGASDTFVFGPGFGKDTITDFAAGAGSQDVIEFEDNIFSDFASVLAAASQVGADTLISVDANNTLTLKNVAVTSLHQDDFVFIAA